MGGNDMDGRFLRIYHQIKENRKVQYVMFGVLAMTYGIVYYWKFEKSVIPPQTGWWQYMAWRMNEGELPYRDFYLFMPPYFLLFTSFLFKLFGKHFMLYAITGFILTRLIVWLMLYKMLSSVLKPFYAAMGLITGISITSAYLVDQVYDYNPLIMLVVVTIAYLIFLLDRCESRKKNVLIFLVGLLCGCIIMMKQNAAIVVPPVSLLCILLMKWKRGYKVKDYTAECLLFCSGLAAAIAPGVIYLFYNHIWEEFVFCISSAISAKVANSSVLHICLGNFFRIQELICAFGIVVNYMICKKYRWSKNPALVSGSAVLMALLLCEEFSESLNGFRAGVGYGTFTKYLAFVLIGIVSLCIMDYVLKKTEYGMQYVFLFAMICITAAVGFADSYLSQNMAYLLYEGIDFENMKKQILYISIYIAIFIWMRSAYYFFCRKDERVRKVFLPFTLFLVYVGAGFASASLEELYAVLFISAAVAYLFEFAADSKLGKYGSVILCFLLCFLCISQKLYMPYSWHGWRTPSLTADGEIWEENHIDGLEGYILPGEDGKTYSDIIALILENSGEEDILFQFSNIPLFNVLTERKSIYAVIPYFDVCPDAVAEEAAEQLEDEPPMLVLFHEMGEWRWTLHEDIFRNSARSGQRSILDFYLQHVKTSYRMLGRFSSNTGEGICLWKRTVFHGGNAEEAVLARAGQQIRQKIKFTGSGFCKIALQKIAQDNLMGVELHITLKNLSSGEMVLDGSCKVNETEDNYYVCEVGEHTVNENDLYELEISCKDSKSHAFGFCPVTDGKYSAEIGGKKIGMVLGITID